MKEKSRVSPHDVICKNDLFHLFIMIIYCLRYLYSIISVDHTFIYDAMFCVTRKISQTLYYRDSSLPERAVPLMTDRILLENF